jgi:hypothetical protein
MLSYTQKKETARKKKARKRKNYANEEGKKKVGKNRRKKNSLLSSLNTLYYSQSIIRMIKSPRLRWVGHVARMR